MSYAIMRVEKIKSNNGLKKMLNHNHRTDLDDIQKRTENNYYKHIDASKTHLNTALFSEKEASNRYEKRKNDLTKTVRKDAVHALEIFFTSDAEFFSADFDYKKFEAINKKFLVDNFGGEKNIINMVLHRDEKTPHMHASIIPVAETTKNGEAVVSLASKRFFGGRDSLCRLQTNYFDLMHKAFPNIERGIKRDTLTDKEKMATKNTSKAEYEMSEFKNLQEKKVEEFKRKEGEKMREKLFEASQDVDNERAEIERGVRAEIFNRETVLHICKNGRYERGENGKLRFNIPTENGKYSVENIQAKNLMADVNVASIRELKKEIFMLKEEKKKKLQICNWS